MKVFPRFLSAAITAALSLFFVALAAVPATATSWHAESATATTAWSVVPANAQGADGRVSLRHELDPGATVTDAIEVRNTGTADGVFQVHAGDGLVGSNGAFDIAPGEASDAGSWVTIDGLDNGTLALKAGESRVLPIIISAPADALAGDHPAGIVVALSTEGTGVSVTHRVGVRLHLQVTGEITPSLEITSSKLVYDASLVPFGAGTATVEYTLQNTGNVRLGALVNSEVGGPFGWGAAASASDAPIELLPGDSVTRTTELNALPLGWLSGELEVTPVAIGDDTTTMPAALTVPLSSTAIAWTTILVVVLVIAAFVWLVVRPRTSAEADLSSE